MQIKLYSPTHLTEAKILFPDKVKDRSWLDSLWTEEEINACKTLETQAFLINPDLGWLLDKFPGFMNEIYFQKSESPHLVRTIDSEQPKSIRSIGCGFGRKELFLARKYPHIKFYCDDIAPHIDQLNVVASQLGLSNIEFHDSKSCRFPKADLVYCGAVFYCIEADKLKSFFSFVGEQGNPGSKLFMTEVAYLNPYVFFRSLISGLFLKRMEKQTGWRRTLSFINNRFPKNLKLIYYDLDLHKAPGRLPRFMARISSKFFPIFASRLTLILQVV